MTVAYIKNTGSRPSARSPHHAGRFAVQSRPDTEHRADDGHGASLTSIFPMGRTTGRLVATFTNRHLIKFASPYPDPRVEFTDAMLVPWDNGRGLLHAFPPFKMVPQVLQKVAQSPGVQIIVIAPLQETASSFPEPLDLSQEDPIPSSNLHACRLCRPF